MKFQILTILATMLLCSFSIVEAREYRSGEEIAAAINSINYDTDWEGVSSFRDLAMPCQFSMNKIAGKYYLDIDEALPDRDLETLVTVYFSPNTPFIYTQPEANKDYFFRMVGGETRFFAVEITYYKEDKHDEKAKIRLRTGKRSATCIVPGDF